MKATKKTKPAVRKPSIKGSKAGTIIKTYNYTSKKSSTRKA